MITHEPIDEALLERVLDEARASPRRRRNYNFHRREGDPCQRLLQPCVVFEAKAGPYAPHLPSELAAFAPEESSPQAASYFAGLKRLFDGAA